MKHQKPAPSRPEAPAEPRRPHDDFREDLLLRAALAFVGKPASDPHKKAH